ncbi:MAG TPA: sugar phosphate nucleotidyltransferase [Acidimicrobiia bacterium]|jgi:NDP-sugar pyrophosphorylase family protein
MQCVILAGGLGTRMRPATDRVPKTLLPVAGSPFAAHQLTMLSASGVTDVVYCIGHLGQRVRDYVGDGHRFGLTVRYVDEHDELRGTGGALRLAADRGVLSERFLVLYGDSYLPTDFGAVDAAFARDDAAALMTVFHNRDRWVPSNVVFDGRRVVAYDKEQRHPGMEWVDYGVSVLGRDVVAGIPSGAVVDLAAVFGGLSRSGRLAGFEVQDRFYEIGSPDGLRDVEAHLAAHPAGAVASGSA